MTTKGTYFQNNPDRPIVFGAVEIYDVPSRRRRGEPIREAVLCKTVLTGFCGTDYELMKMGSRCELEAKFPKGRNRLINGHEGVVWVPSENRFAVVLIRGGNSYDPTRYMDDEDYFEYGCDGADGLMCFENYYNPDMLLKIPDGYAEGGKIPLQVAERLTFADPYACMIFQRERMEDLGSAQNFRLEMAIHKCGEAEARERARVALFDRVLIFGLGTTGMFMGDLIKQKYPQANIVMVGRSDPESPKVKYALEKTKGIYVQNTYDREEESAKALVEALGGKATLFIGCSGTETEHRLAFDYGVLGNNGIYNSFSLGPNITVKSMPFGFRNHLIFGSINFRQDHMEEAIKILCRSDYDRIVELIEPEEFMKSPQEMYEQVIYAKGAPLKSAMIWAPDYIE